MARKRPRIYPRTLQNGEMRFDVSFDFVDYVTGRRKQQMRTFRTEREARQALAEHEAALGKGPRYVQSAATLAQCVEEFLKAQPDLRPTTMQTYRSTLATHVLPQLGSVPTARLSQTRLHDHYSALRAAGVKAGMIRNAHQRIVQVLRWAAVRGYAVDASALQTKTPRYEPKEMSCWSDGEISRFLEAASQDALGGAWRLAIHTGMRRGELIGLEWQDIGWESGLIHVRRSRTPVGGRMIVGPTKNGKARAISVHSSVLEALRAHRAAQLAARVRQGTAWREPGLVFTSNAGGPLLPDTLRRHLASTVERAGLAPIRIHDLRHTHASFLLRHGKSVVEVSKRLGHTNVAQTLNTYAHCIPEEHKATAELLGRLFG